MPAPDNYMGPSRIFGLHEDEDAGLGEIAALPITRTVSDHANSDGVDETEGWMPPKLIHRTDHIPRFEGRAAIPPSLREAIMAFVLSTAVRKQRESGTLFNSMLIHVVRYTKIQNEVATQVAQALKDIQQRLRNGDGERKPTITNEFEQLWHRDFAPTTINCARVMNSTRLILPTWEAVHPMLESVASGIQIKIINGTAGDVLDYEIHKETGMDLIAVGGDKLSRGLTLEGLTVSYFLRASRMYDTLMQMGRWFGYKENYIDICRLYTPAELLEWYTHIACRQRRTPERVRAHGQCWSDAKGLRAKSPISSHYAGYVSGENAPRNRNALSFAGDISETIIFKRDPKWLSNNFACG